MDLRQLVTHHFIDLDLDARNRDEAIHRLAGLLAGQGLLTSLDQYLESVYARERLGSTAVGMGVAIPHGKSAAVRRAAVAFGRSRTGFVWDPEDPEPTDLVFLIAVPEEGAGDQHLAILAALAARLMDDDFRLQLRQAPTPASVVELISVSSVS